MKDNVSKRLEKIKPFLHRQKIEAILLTSAANIFYLTSFLFRDSHEKEAVAIVAKNSVELFVPKMFQDQAEKVFKNIQVKICDERNRLYLAIIRRLKNKKVGFESYNLTVGQYNALRQKQIRLTPLSKKFIFLRQEKTKEELEKIKKAVEITDKAFEVVLKEIKPGKTERQITALIKQKMEELGADGEAFETIIASGKNSAIPHHQPTNKKIKNSEIVLIDMGAKKDGYNSDLTRTIFVGKPTPQFINRYKIVKQAQENVIKKARSKMSGEKVDRFTREVFKKHQLEKYFLHSTGHGIGIKEHEAPRLALKIKQKITSSSIITIEPGLYFPGWGGIRIEDAAVMTEKGLKVFSKAPYLV